MAHPIVRGPLEVSRIEWPGVVARRYVEPEQGLGALRLLDDLVVQPSARASLEAYGGYEAVAYGLEGECIVEDDRGQSVRLGAGHAARACLADGARGSIRNASAAAARVLVACVVARSTDPRPLLGRGPLARDERGIAWIAAHGGEHRIDLASQLGESTRIGVGALDPGVEVRFAAAIDRRLLVVVLTGAVELQSVIVSEGGDARYALDRGATLQGVARARVVIADVPLAYVQRVA